MTYHPPSRQPASPHTRFTPDDKPLPCPEGHWGHGTALPWYEADGLDATAAAAGLHHGLALLEKVTGRPAGVIAAASRAQFRGWSDECRRWAGLPLPSGRIWDVVAYGSAGIFSSDAGWTAPY